MGVQVLLLLRLHLARQHKQVKGSDLELQVDTLPAALLLCHIPVGTVACLQLLWPCLGCCVTLAVTVPGATPSFGFGSSQPAGGSVFGQPAPQSQSAATPAFGQQATSQPSSGFATPSTGFGFGQSQAAASTGGGFSFGLQSSPAPFGQSQPAASASSLPAFGTSIAHTAPGKAAADVCEVVHWIVVDRIFCTVPRVVLGQALLVHQLCQRQLCAHVAKCTFGTARL